MKDQRGWIGVDFDGTLATYESGMAPLIGAPIPAMVTRVQQWLAQGIEVRIVTARASHPRFGGEERVQLELWCLQHIGAVLAIQCHKDYEMIELWDDRVVQVESNTGRVLGVSRLERTVEDERPGC